MRICMLSDYTGIRDEGLRNIAFYLSRELAKHHSILRLPIRELFLRKTWRKIREFNPRIIHFVPGPTLKSFVIVRVLKTFCPQAKTVMSATIPALSNFSKRFVPMLKPDLLLTQSNKSEKMFIHLGCRVHFLPNGVDISKFRPVDDRTKRTLRRKYGLDENRPLLLHVGSITKKRNILILNEMRRRNSIQILVVGSLSIPAEQEAQLSLVKGGCCVIREYIEKIEEVYSMADCYIFPTIDEIASVELPLSVMEAMACNLPIITTRFGALPRLFEEGDGLFYAKSLADFNRLLHKILEENVEVRTREKVMPYSWERVGEKLRQLYEEVLLRSSEAKM